MSLHSRYRRAVPLVLAVVLCAPAVAMAQGIPEPHAAVRTSIGDITAMRKAYAEAFNAKDAKAVSGMFTADAVATEFDGTQSVGWSEIAKRNEAAAPTWPHIVIASQSVKLYGNTAVDVGTVTAHPADGNEMMYRYTVVLRHDMHGWKVQDLAETPMAK